MKTSLGIWAFGGRTTLGTNTRNDTERLQRMARRNANMVGTAVFAEGMDTNPFAFDLFTEMAWREQPLDLPQWTADYAQRRYGALDAHAAAAWKTLLATAYDIRVDKVVFNSERDAAQESLFDAQPGLDVNRASHWSPEAMRYPAGEFRHALTELLQVDDPFAAHREGIRVVPLVGPSAVLLALMASGLDGQRFAFHGYLPQKADARAAAVRALETDSRAQARTQLFIETPYRNEAMLETLATALAPATRVCVACDLTLPGESIVTLPARDWRARPRTAYARRPAIFLLHA